MNNSSKNSGIFEKLRAAGVIYELAADGMTVKTTIGKRYTVPKIVRTDNVAIEFEADNAVYMNKGVRCGDTMLFAGALPCFAMGTVNRDEKGHMPPIVAMGEFHFSAEYGGNELFFDEADRIEAEFVPNGTKWSIYFDRLCGVCFHLYASLAGDYGIAAALSAEGIEESEKIRIVCRIEKARIGDHVPTYFSENCRKIDTVYGIRRDGGYVEIRSGSGEKEYRRNSAYGINCAALPQIEAGSTVKISFDAPKDGELLTISGVHAPYRKEPDMQKLVRRPEEIRGIIREAEEKYAALLGDFCVRTQDPLLDAGIGWALLNLDYVYVRPFWLEGGQWWNVPFTNNYQLSAAVSAGQYARARGALSYFANLEDGYSVIALNGESLDRWTRRDGTKALGFDGIPYYIYQLRQYAEQTGDLAAVSETAENINKMCGELVALCDPDGDGLLSWNRASNAFLYQADHLFLPGAGASPSLMMAGNFEGYAKMLAAAGMTEQAERYAEISARIYRALPGLWDDACGYFLAGIDLGGTRCRTHFYTDLVFPVLYAEKLPEYQQILPLMHLKQSLLYRSPVTGGLLMRMGEFKPDLFGNNYTQPVQIAEAARAFFKIGEYKTGYELLCSCGCAMSVFTENPGSSPEKLNRFGKGEADYMFGNPAASFVYAAAAGLMGVRTEDLGNTLVFEPGFPLDLEAWSFRTPYICAEFKNNMESDGSLMYKIALPGGDERTRGGEKAVSGVKKAQKIRFSLFVPHTEGLRPAEDIHIFASGSQVRFSVLPGLNAHKVTAEIGSTTVGIADSGGFELALKFDKPYRVIETVAEEIIVSETIEINAGEAYELPKNEDREYFGARTAAISHAGTFYRMFYDKKEDVYGLIRVNVRKIPEEKRAGKLGFIAPEALDIGYLLNSDGIRASNAWRYGGQFSPAFCEQREEDGDVLVQAEGTVYKAVRAVNGDGVRVCRLSVGTSDIVGRKITMSEQPDHAIVKVRRAVRWITLLYIAETEVRLSGAEQQFGTIRLSYRDGQTETIPLVSRDNIGSIIGNYAENTYKVPLRTHAKDSANHYCIACDGNKILEEIRIGIEKEDVEFGLIAVNILPA